MHTATSYTYTCSYRVDALVEAFYSNLSTLTWHTSNSANSDKSVGNLRNLSFEKTLKEFRAGTRKDNLWIVVLVVYTLNNGADSLTLTILVSRNLLCLRQDKLVVLIVNNENLALPYLVNLSCNNLTYAILIFIVKRIVLKLKNL